MKKVSLLSSIILLIAGAGMTWLSIKRSVLPYNEEGRYFDSINGVSYNEQAVIVYCCITAVFMATGLIAFWWSRK
jgi:hypothetical protein